MVKDRYHVLLRCDISSKNGRLRATNGNPTHMQYNKGTTSSSRIDNTLSNRMSILPLPPSMHIFAIQTYMYISCVHRAVQTYNRIFSNFYYPRFVII